MNKIQAKNMLNDVVEHFSSNPCKLRSRSKIGTCLYNPPSYKTESIGCAIGMYISKEDAMYLDIHGGTIESVFNVYEDLSYNEELWYKLPKWMQKMDPNFLSEIQNLHDVDENWTNTTISEKGEGVVLSIIKTYNL